MLNDKLELKEVVRLNFKNGDVLFVDVESVDCQALMHWRPNLNIIIVPMTVPHGKTVGDCVAVAADRRKYDGPWSGVERRVQ